MELFTVSDDDDQDGQARGEPSDPEAFGPWYRAQWGRRSGRSDTGLSDTRSQFAGTWPGLEWVSASERSAVADCSDGRVAHGPIPRPWAPLSRVTRIQ